MMTADALLRVALSCRSLNFSARFVASLCYEGLLPICCELGGGTGLYVLLPKLHVERCILLFDQRGCGRSTCSL